MNFDTPDPANSWASLVKSNVEPGIQRMSAGKPRVCRTKAQTVAYEKKLAEEEKKQQLDFQERIKVEAVHVDLDSIMSQFDTTVFHVFANSYDWDTIDFMGIVTGLADAVDLGTYSECTWWHVYSPALDVVVQFEFDYTDCTIRTSMRTSLPATYKIKATTE